MLSDWWVAVETGVEFVRTPSSGGWQTPTVRAEFRACGDIMTTAKRFPWCVEVKRREAWSERGLFLGRPSPVWAWWEQTLAAAATAKQRPMLWFRQSRRSWFVAFDREREALTWIPKRFVRDVETDVGAIRVLACEVLLATTPEKWIVA